jgi:cytochrome c oxidase subunit II
MNPAPLLPQTASVFAAEYEQLFWFFMISCGLAAVVTFMVGAYFVVRYRRGTGNYVKPNGHDHTWLEVAWSMPVLFVVTILFVWGARLFVNAYVQPDTATEIFVTGKQWMWKIQHPNGKREINELHVPINTQIKLTMTSEDVIHSFFIPAFRLKRDVLPGRYTQMWFEATKEGEFHLFCAEYCGTEHSRMVGRVVVMGEGDYQEWISRGEEIISMEEQGERLFERHACGSCHNDSKNARGPSLAGIYDRTRLLRGGHRVRGDANYIRESVLRPNAKVVAGYDAVMPTYQGQIDEEGLNQLVAYLRSLDRSPAEQALLEPDQPKPQGERLR